jgi:hypothetical protein
MKMTTFDGNNIYSQIRKMNEDPVGTATMMAARQLEPRGGVPSSGYNTAGFNQSFGK